jgi:hypothetical protein
VHGAAISDAQKQQIFHGTLRSLMNPILKAKGIQA